ncbi:hypothetical protein, partial [Undibacterium umbellatum]|uniref:hypothetical protein n=1 Tax=Undibacterium umbellatum TaxID=2762300 RepID=UPI001C9A43E6
MTDEEKYLSGMNLEGLSPQAIQIYIALAQSNSGDPITQSCLDCNQLLNVEALSINKGIRPCAWTISCPCGKCNTTFRGL